MSHKYVYLFSEGNGKMRELLGGKGANLAEMTNLGMPVPQGFTITTEACTQYYKDDHQINAEIEAEIMEYVEKLEEMTGKKFGDLYNPLLVSVRSGARASMPGMMDTILNLGLNEDVVEVIAKKSGNPRWAYDCYRRFIQMYSDVVMEVGKKYFEQLIDEMKEKKGVKLDTELDANDLKELAEKFKAEYKDKLGEEFPQDPKMQLMGAIKAVFRSWDNPRANVYRRDNDIPYSWGTAVNVQSMAFGNMGDDCGTGVAFTRNPATGEKKLFGEFLTNAQGEDVVAGVRTPMPIAQMAKLTHRLCPDAIFHTDAVQGFLKIPFQAKTLGADLISVSSHKIHGPKGAGALYISPRLKSFPPLIHGGGQENNLRSGTEATPALFGFGAAAAAGAKTFREDIARERALLEGLCARLEALPGVQLNGAHEAPHILSVSIPGVPTQNSINILQDAQICVSAGSACAKGHRSHVLTAMNVPEQAIDSAFRVSLSRETTQAEIDALVETIRKDILPRI